jgi:cobalt/nickel transport system permease protein
MHLPDGVLPFDLALVTTVGGMALTGLALARIRALPDPQAEIPRAAMLTAVFFAASSIALPVPPTSAHLVLTGLMGVMLGWFAVPALLVGLFLQAVLFGHGGLTSLGANLLILAPTALVCRAAYDLLSPRLPDVAAAIAGIGGVVLSIAVFAALVLAALPDGVSAQAERAALLALALAHLPLALVEGVVVFSVLRVLRRIEPGLLPRG